MILLIPWELPGIEMKMDPLNWKQVGFTDRILEALSLGTTMANIKWTPAESNPLVKNEDGEGPPGSFSYSSVMWMLLFLSNHS